MLPFSKITKDKKKLQKILKDIIFYLNKNKLYGIIELNKIYGFFISMRYGVIDKIESYDYIKCIITIYNNGRKVSVSCNNLSIVKIINVIKKAVNIIKYTEFDIFSSLPKENLLYNHKKNLNIFFPCIFNTNNIIKIIKLVEKNSLNFDVRITNTEGVIFESLITLKYLGNSCGWFDSHISTYNCLSSCVIASDKNSMERDFSYTAACDFYDLKSPELIGQDSARKSIAKLNPKKIKTQRIPVIFSSDISSSLFKYLVGGLNGYAVYKKSTFLLKYLGKKIFPKWLNIFEDPFLDKGLRSRLFDDEGVATIPRKIIDNGRIVTWLLDTYSSNQLNCDSTGHSGGIYNWLVSSNIPVLSYSSLLKKMNYGIVITEVFGSGVNIMTGDYSRGACGFLVKNGSVIHPVSEITISGNLLEIWKNIISLSNDVQKNNNITCSSILVDNIQISGN